MTRAAIGIAAARLVAWSPAAKGFSPPDADAKCTGVYFLGPRNPDETPTKVRDRACACAWARERACARVYAHSQLRIADASGINSRRVDRLESESEGTRNV